MTKAFEIITGDSSNALVFLADHAMNHVPPSYDNLGLSESDLTRHIAYDIGVEDLTRALAAKLDATAVISGFSRLLVDANRGEKDPTLIMKLSDGAIIPANHPLSPEEREYRITTWHRPYHNAIAETLDGIEAATGKTALVISIHSFTPFWKGVARPWHASLLWDNDPRVTDPFIELLSADGTLTIGSNEPYDGALKDDCMYRHCMTKGRPHTLLEIRQDLISDKEGVAQWVDRLVPILTELNGRPELHQIGTFKSRLDI